MTQSPRSSFFKDKYAREGFTKFRMDTEADVENIPRLTRAELLQISPFERLYMSPRDVKFLRYTSGTSGGDLLLMFRGVQRDTKPGERPLILGTSSQMEAHCAIYAREGTGDHFPALIHFSPNPKVTAELARQYEVDAMYGVPSKIISLANILLESTRMGVLHIGMVGETVLPSTIRDLQKLFPNAEIRNYYGLSEVGEVGYQCATLAKNPRTFHPHEEFLLECTDPETGRHVPLGQEGEILLTELVETPHQLIRYRTGDGGTLIEKACPCGGALMFEVMGRIGHDLIKTAGGLLRVDEIERVVAELSQQVLPDFRATLTFEEEKPVFRLSLIPRLPDMYHLASRLALSDQIAARLYLTTTKTLQDFLHEGAFKRFDIEFVERFPLDVKAQRLRLLR